MCYLLTFLLIDLAGKVMRSAVSVRRSVTLHFEPIDFSRTGMCGWCRRELKVKVGRLSLKDKG